MPHIHDERSYFSPVVYTGLASRTSHGARSFMIRNEDGCSRRRGTLGWNYFGHWGLEDSFSVYGARVSRRKTRQQEWTYGVRRVFETISRRVA